MLPSSLGFQRKSTPLAAGTHRCKREAGWQNGPQQGWARWAGLAGLNPPAGGTWNLELVANPGRYRSAGACGCSLVTPVWPVDAFAHFCRLTIGTTTLRFCQCRLPAGGCPKQRIKESLRITGLTLSVNCVWYADTRSIPSLSRRRLHQKTEMPSPDPPEPSFIDPN